MKSIAEMSIEQLGAHVCQSLADHGIVVTLTGGAVRLNLVGRQVRVI